MPQPIVRWINWHLPGLDDWTVALAGAFLVCGIVGFVLLRRAIERRSQVALDRAVADDLHLPASLHPVIDPDVCIGSLSCITACPEGDILGVVDGVAKLIIGSNCIGHGRCVTECPVDAIKLVIGTAERGVDLPEVDTNFESSRAGVHVVGELSGMGLIKNAIRQGLQAAEFLGRRLGRTQEGCDVAIVGAGPAGLATAIGLRAAGARIRIFEQARFGGTIAHYPRQKVVMSERVSMPIVGTFGSSLISKEELLASFTKMAKKAQLEIEEGVKVEGIDGVDGRFELRTSKGPVQARKVVLATGRRGSPRKLGVPGEDLAKVTYALDDPEQYAKSRVLVVGGGDSALEAAIQLAERGDVEVTLSYRKGAFGKVRDRNRKRVQELITSGEIHALMPSTVERVEPELVTLTSDGKPLQLPNDWVIACLGGELPVEFLRTMGVGLKRHAGDKTVHMPALGPARAGGTSNQLAIGLWLVGLAIVAGLAFVGHDYYLLDRRARAHSPLHDLLRSSGPWGHGVGIVATAFMMLNFLYPLRKRWGFMKGTAPIRSWLTFHIFVGVMSPLVIAFHAAFQSRNQLATATFASLCVVVGTGLCGRFVYGLVPNAGGTALELSLVRAQLQREQARLRPSGEATASDARLERLLGQLAPDAAKGRSLLVHLLGLPLRYPLMRAQIRGVRKKFESRARYQDFKGHYLAARRLHMQVTFYRSLRRLLSGWRVFHVVLSVLLVLIIALHVGLSIYLGYRWIF
jgi:thioredoxin reductase/Pyruvate/2-oxoacid:ferredoxin oxidoreductase delta subunit